MEQPKPIHTLILDTGAIIKNDPPISTLLRQCESLATVPAILSEIRDTATRARVETTLRPFLTVRSPDPASVKFVTEFARRTGDLAVLSKADVQIIALTYDIECERNGGDWRLRRVPGQKGVNGPPPAKAEDASETGAAEPIDDTPPEAENVDSTKMTLPGHSEVVVEAPTGSQSHQTTEVVGIESQDDEETLSETFARASVSADESSPNAYQSRKVDSPREPEEVQQSSESDSDSGGWITPSNLKKKQAEDAGASTTQTAEPKIMQAAVITTDFAMQNVILQMNLNLLSRSLTRVKHLKTFVLRCHACFQTTRDMSKQFCPRCGQPALTRVSCSTSANGEFKLHLKRNMQWNHRGERYSIPKPVSGSANGKVKGGGKDGWGNGLIFAEDQKEYQRAVTQEKRTKARDLMDEDYLPSILTGDRRRAGGRIKVGAGRNVNSKKRS